MIARQQSTRPAPACWRRSVSGAASMPRRRPSAAWLSPRARRQAASQRGGAMASNSAGIAPTHRWGMSSAMPRSRPRLPRRHATGRLRFWKTAPCLRTAILVTRPRWNFFGMTAAPRSGGRTLSSPVTGRRAGLPRIAGLPRVRSATTRPPSSPFLKRRPTMATPPISVSCPAGLSR